MISRSYSNPAIDRDPRSPTNEEAAQPLDFVFDRFLDVFHANVAIRQTRGVGLPLLFLHGEAGTKATFDRQLRSALGQGHRCIAIDFPGHGASSPLYEAGTSDPTQVYADTAADVMEALDLDQFVVIGHAMGGTVAIEMMTTVPGVIGVFVGGTILPNRSGASGIPLALVDGDDGQPMSSWVEDQPNLWTGARHVIPGGGATPFIEAAPLYNHLLTRFAHDMDRRARGLRNSPRLAYSA